MKKFQEHLGARLVQSKKCPLGVRKCNAYLRSGPPKVSYLASLAASFSAPLAAFQAITSYLQSFDLPLL